MHVATRDILRKHFSKADFEVLGPLLHCFFTNDETGLTDAYLQKLLDVRRTNMYDKRKRIVKMLKAGVDYAFALDEHNKRVMRFTYNAFIICVRSSYSPAMIAENRRRIEMVLDFDRITGSILAAHNAQSDVREKQSRATLLQMKQKQVAAEDDVERLRRTVARLESRLDDLQEEKRKLKQSESSVRGVLGRTLRELVHTMGYSVDESRAKDIRKWFNIMSARQQGVAQYDVKTLSGGRKDYFLVDEEKVEDLRRDISQSTAKLPLK